VRSVVTRGATGFEHPTLEQFVSTFRECSVTDHEESPTALFDKGWVASDGQRIVDRGEEASSRVFDRAGKRETVTPGTLAGSIWQGWALVMRHGTLRFPVDIELWGADGSVQLGTLGREGTYPVASAARAILVRVIVDPA